MQDAFAYCEQLVRAADKDRYLASLFAPADKRPSLLALYSFNLEIARVADVVTEPLAGEVRLQWWHEVAEGGREGEAAASPVARALRETMARHDIPAGPLTGLIDARRFDLYREPMQRLADLQAYLHTTSSTIFALAAQILAGRKDALGEAAGPAGSADGMTTVLRMFGLHASRRQLYLPVELLRRHGVEPETVFAAQESPGLLAAIAELREEAKRQLVVLRSHAGVLSPPLVPALLPLALVGAYLDRLERRDYDPFGSIIVIPQWRRQWLMWRAARRPALIARGRR